MRHPQRSEAGFTILEMIVAVGLFAVVMIVSVAALLSLVHANRKAQALESVMNNLNIALDGIVRSIRMGSAYHCGTTGSFDIAQDCNDSDGDTFLAIEEFGGDPLDAGDQRVYRFVPPTGVDAGYIERSDDSGAAGTYTRLTSPEVLIEEMAFYVVGTERAENGDTIQPKAIVVVKGVAGGGNVKTRSSFHIQSTAVQRILDL